MKNRRTLDLAVCPALSLSHAHRFLVLALLAALGLISSAASAATVTWDASGNVTGGNATDGSGTWSTTGTNWDNGGTDSAWTTGNDAVIGNGGTAGTITVSGGVTADSITFNPVASGTYYTITGSTITLTGSGEIVTNAAGATINSVLAGSVGLVTSGTGTLTLGGANSYTGSTIVSSGTTDVTGSIATSSPVVIGSNGSTGATLEITAAQTLASLTTGSGAAGSSLILNETGTQFFNVTGAVTLNSPLTITKVNDGGVNWAAFEPNGGITGNGGGAGNDSLIFSDLGGVKMYIQGEAGTFNFAGNVHFLTDNGQQYIWQGNSIIPSTSSVTLDSGATINQSDGADAFNIDGLNGAGTWNGSGGTLTVGSAGGSGTFSGVIGSSWNFVKTGTGTQILSGANSYTGSTIINSGTLQIGNGGSTGSLLTSSAVSGSSGAALAFNEIGSLTFANTISGGLGLLQEGTGALALTASNSYTGGTIISSGTVNINADVALGGTGSGVTFSGAGTLQSGSNNISLVSTRGITLDSGITGTVDTQANAMTINGVIGGLGALAKISSGTLTLTGNNTYSGNTTISGGILEFSATDAMPSSGTVTTGSGAAMAVAIGGAGQFTTATSGAGSIGGLDAGVGGQGGVVTWSSGAALGIDTTAASGTYAGVIANPGSNVLGLTKLGLNTLTLTASNTYTGVTTISAGTLQLGDGVSNNGYVAGNITDNATLAFANPVTQTYNLAVSGSGALTKSGAGLLTLGGANTYTGSTTVTTGTVNVAGSISSSSPVVIGSNGSTNATLEITAAQTLASLSTGSGATGSSLIYNQSGNQFFNVTGAVTLNSPLTITKVSNGAWAVFEPNGGITGNGGGTGNDSLIFSDLGGAQMYIQGEAGTYNFAGNVHFLTDNGQYYDLQGGSIFAPTASVTLDSGATVYSNSSGVNYAFDALNGAGAWYVQSGANTLTMGSAGGSGTFSGIIGTSMSVVKTGAGTEIFTGANSYSGTTTISAGTLQVGNGGSTGSLGSGNIVDNASLVYDLSSTGSVTLPSGSAISGSGSLSVTAGGGSTGYTDITLTGNVTLGGSQSYIESGSNAGANQYQGIQVYQSSPVLTASSITMSGDVGVAGGSIGDGLTLNTSAANGPINLNISLGRGNGGVWYNLSGFTANSGTGTITVSGAGPTSAGWNSTPVTLTGGVVNVTSGVSSNAAVTINPSLTSLASGAFSGSMSLTDGGPGTLVLTGANTYTGATTINAGTLQIGNGGTTGSLSSSTAISGSSGATLAFNLSSSGTVSNSISNGIGVTQMGSGTLTLTGNNTYSGTTNVTGGGTLICQGNISGNATVNGGTLGVVGTIGGNLTVGNNLGAASSSVINPSLGVTMPGDNNALTINGNVTLKSDSLFKFTLNSSGPIIAGVGTSDYLYVPNGTLTLGGSIAGLDANYTPLTPGSAQFLIAYAEGGITGTFSNVSENGWLQIGENWYTINYGEAGDASDPGYNADYITLTAAIPEPGTWGMMMGGMGLLIAFQRRRRARSK